MPYPDALDTFPTAADLADDNLSTKPHSTLHGDLGVAVLALEKKAGFKRIHASEWGVLPTNTAAENTFLFNTAMGALTTPAKIIFEPATYPTLGFAVTRSGVMLEGTTGLYWSTIFENQSSTANTVSFTTNATTFPERLRGCGMRGITLTESASTTGAAIYIRHMTHGFFERVWVEGYNGQGGGVNASSFADSIFLGCDFEACSSFDNSNKPVLYFHNDNDNALWNVDAIKFIGCRFEACGDRIAHFNLGSGVGANLLVNKITFHQCKFETNDATGSNDANQSQFLLNNCSGIVFSTCDFTLQDKNVAHTLQTIFRLQNVTSLLMSDTVFNFGSGSYPKCFTNFFVLNNAQQLLSLSNVWVNSGNATAYPTQVIACTGTPRVVYKSVGFTPFQGSAKTASDWITGATANTTGGAGGGVIA